MGVGWAYNAWDAHACDRVVLRQMSHGQSYGGYTGASWAARHRKGRPGSGVEGRRCIGTTLLSTPALISYWTMLVLLAHCYPYLRYRSPPSVYLHTPISSRLRVMSWNASWLYSTLVSFGRREGPRDDILQTTAILGQNKLKLIRTSKPLVIFRTELTHQRSELQSTQQTDTRLQLVSRY